MTSDFKIKTAAPRFDVTGAVGGIVASGVLETVGIVGATGTSSSTGGISTTYTGTLSGLWNDDLPISITLQKSIDGKTVQMILQGITTSSDVNGNIGGIDINPSLPSGYRPDSFGFRQSAQSMVVLDNNEALPGMFFLNRVDNSFFVSVKKPGDFTGTGITGFQNQIFTYPLNRPYSS